MSLKKIQKILLKNHLNYWLVKENTRLLIWDWLSKFTEQGLGISG